MKQFLNKNKKLLLNILSVSIKTVPVLTVFILNFDFFVDRSSKSLSLMAMVVILFMILVFKDSLKKYFVKPTGLNTALVLTGLSYLAVTFGESVLQLSVWFLVSTLVALPVDIYIKHLDKPKDISDELISTIESLRKRIEVVENDRTE